MRILLMSTGRRVSLIQRLRKTACEMKLNLYIAGTEIYPWTPSLQFCDSYHMVAPTFSDEHLKQLEEIIKNENLNAVLPGNDYDLDFLQAVRNRPVWQSVKILDAGSNQGVFLSKSQSADFFKSVELKVPDIYQKPSDVNKAMILKEDRGHGSINQYIVNDSIDASRYWNRLKQPFLQEFIEGVEYTIDVFSSEDYETINVCPRIRQKVRAGVSDVGEVHLNRELIDLLLPKLPLFKLRGPWNVQCILRDSTFYFLEVNPRFSGGVPLSIAAGCDLVQNLVEWYLGISLTKFDSLQDGLIMMKYEQELFVSSRTV